MKQFVALAKSQGPAITHASAIALAVTSTARLAELPDVPTTTEAGVPNAEAVFWTGLFAPKGTPKEILSRLEAEIKTTMQAPEVQQQLRTLATDPAAGAPAEFTDRIKADLKVWSEVAKAANVTME